MTKIINDIAYACQSPDQKLDVYLPEESRKPYPVVVWLHPGGFTMGTKDMIKPFVNAITGRRYAAVSIDYRLAQEARFPAQIFDAKAAVRWVRANAAEYGFDPDKIATWGISAGATLAALLGTSGDIKELEDIAMGNSEASSRVNAVIDWYGPVDFTSLDSQLRRPGQAAGWSEDKSGVSDLFGGSFSEVPDKYRAASPVTYISDKCPPFYIQHGDADELIPLAQSVLFAEALEKMIGQDNVQIRLIKHAGHFDRTHSAPENVNASLDFLDIHF